VIASVAILTPNMAQDQAKPQEEITVSMPTAANIGPPSFKDPYEAREYLKGRLALAFRIFAKFEYDEGVAGHITLRVSDFPSQTIDDIMGLLCANYTIGSC
jgi:hypothetical protein